MCHVIHVRLKTTNRRIGPLLTSPQNFFARTDCWTKMFSDRQTADVVSTFLSENKVNKAFAAKY